MESDTNPGVADWSDSWLSPIMRIYGVRTASVARPPGTIEITDRGTNFRSQVFDCEI